MSFEEAKKQVAQKVDGFEKNAGGPYSPDRLMYRSIVNEFAKVNDEAGLEDFISKYANDPKAFDGLSAKEYFVNFFQDLITPIIKKKLIDAVTTAENSLPSRSYERVVLQRIHDKLTAIQSKEELQKFVEEYAVDASKAEQKENNAPVNFEAPSAVEKFKLEVGKIRQEFSSYLKPPVAPAAAADVSQKLSVHCVR